MPNLRKTDFVRIAAILKDLRDACDAIATDLPELQAARRGKAFDSAARSLGKALAPHNGKFNMARFLESCGVK